MTRRKQAAEKGDGKEVATLDFGLGGFLDLISNMVEMGESKATRTSEFNVKGLGDKARGIYGFTVRTGIGGAPQVEHFGNVQTTEEGPVVAEVREPLVDLFDEAEEIIVTIELPGVAR